jgi:hypothetical protein
MMLHRKRETAGQMARRLVFNGAMGNFGPRR